MDKQEAVRRLSKYMKKETLFRLKGDTAGDWRTVKAVFCDKVEAFLVSKYGDKLELIANKDMDAAVASSL